MYNPPCRSKPDDRSLGRRASAESKRGKSELRRAVRRITSGRGNSKDSGTENTPLAVGSGFSRTFGSKGEKVR